MLISKPTKKCKTVIKISFSQGSKGGRMDCLQRTAQKNEKCIYISASEVISRFSIQREGHKTAPF
jgi:hypothetical protein